MRLLILLGLLSQLSITSVDAQVESHNKKDGRFPFNTRSVKTEGEWQFGKLSTKLFQLNVDTKNQPFAQLALTEFPIVGMTRSQIHEKIGSFASNLEDRKLATSANLEDYHAGPPGMCGATGSNTLQLKYENDRVAAYRFYSIGLK